MKSKSSFSESFFFSIPPFQSPKLSSENSGSESLPKLSSSEPADAFKNLDAGASGVLRLQIKEKRKESERESITRVRKSSVEERRRERTDSSAAATLPSMFIFILICSEGIPMFSILKYLTYSGCFEIVASLFTGSGSARGSVAGVTGVCGTDSAGASTGADVETAQTQKI